MASHLPYNKMMSFKDLLDLVLSALHINGSPECYFLGRFTPQRCTWTYC